VHIAFNQKQEPVGQVIAHESTAVAVLTASGDVIEVTSPNVGFFLIPPNIAYADFAAHPFEYRIMCAAKLHPARPANLWRALAESGMSPVRLWLTVELIEYSGQSNFYMSLRDQILKWGDTPPHKRNFAMPLSKRQWDAVLDPGGLTRGKMSVDLLVTGADLPPLETAFL
jgi:hypothetical protein